MPRQNRNVAPSLSALTSYAPGSAPCERQPERDHLTVVAHQEAVTDQHRVVPGLAFHRLETSKLHKLVGCCSDQRKLTLLRQHQQQALIAQQDELAVAVASTFPLALAVLG